MLCKKTHSVSVKRVKLSTSSLPELNLLSMYNSWVFFFLFEIPEVEYRALLPLSVLDLAPWVIFLITSVPGGQSCSQMGSPVPFMFARTDCQKCQRTNSSATLLGSCSFQHTSSNWLPSNPQLPSPKWVIPWLL